MNNRIAALSEKLKRIVDAKNMAQTDVWASAWEGYEQELLERLLACEPEDEMPRYKLQEAIKAVRHVRRVIENAGSGESAVIHELDILEGRKKPPIV